MLQQPSKGMQSNPGSRGLSLLTVVLYIPCRNPLTGNCQELLDSLSCSAELGGAETGARSVPARKWIINLYLFFQVSVGKASVQLLPQCREYLRGLELTRQACQSHIELSV